MGESMDQWYYSIEGVQQGPVAAEEMRAMLASGMIHGGTLIWKEGMENWQSLSRHPVWMAQIASPGGTPIPAYGVLPTTNGLAIASMVCGLVSLPMLSGCWLGVFTAIPAVICGHVALAQLKRLPNQSGRGFAITGLIFGYLVILIVVVAVVVLGIAIASEM